MNDVQWLWFVYGGDRKRARKEYAKRFGKPIDDPMIDGELVRLFDEALGDRQETVAVPTHLMLALAIRPRGKGKGRGHRPEPTERRRLRARVIAVREAEYRWAKLVAEGTPRKRAKHQAAEEVHKEFGRSTHWKSVETLKAKMVLKRGRAELEERTALSPIHPGHPGRS